MAAVASVVSIVLFLAFLTTGLQKVLFNPVMSRVAGHLGLTKRLYQRLGIAEMAAAIAVMVGLKASGSSVLAIVNEVAAGALVALTASAVVTHRRAGDSITALAPAAVLGLLAAIELIFRVVQ